MSHSCRWSNRRSAKGNTGFQYLVEEVSLAAVLATDALSQSHSLGPVRLARGNQLGPLVLAEATLIHDANGIACGLGERHYLVAQLQRGKRCDRTGAATPWAKQRGVDASNADAQED